MRLPIAFSLILSTLGVEKGFGGTVSARDVCREISPNPSHVTSFYEDNPTYDSPPANPSDWEWDRPENQGLNSSTLTDGDKALEALPQPLSFLVYRNGRLVWEKYFHGSQPYHSNNVHSASKSILSALIGIAVEQGAFSVNDTLYEILPSRFKLSGSKKKISVKHLLTMTSGFEWTEDSTEYEIEEESNWAQAILNLSLKTSPGSKFLYSTGNTHLLSTTLTEATGMSTCEFAHRNLFDPMGITVEHWGRDPLGYFSGGYNLYLTPRELLKMGKLYLNGGEWRGKQLLSNDWVRDAFHPWQKVDSVRSYGYLLWQHTARGHRIYKMWGYGGQFVYIVPSLNMVVALTADTKHEHKEMDGNAFLDRYVLGAVIH